MTRRKNHRRSGRRIALILLLALPFALLAPAWGAPPIRYAEKLSEAVAAIETGRHAAAVAPLRAVLALDRNEPMALLTLGTLFLHEGDGTRAEAEFARARLFAPDEPLTRWASAIALAARGTAEPDDFDSFPAESFPAGADIAAYLRLAQGDPDRVRARFRAVDTTETDLIRLEIAGFAALRCGETKVGESLLKALLDRPAMRKLAEDRALILAFDPENRPLEGASPSVMGLAKLASPSLANVETLRGRATLTPPASMSEDRVAYVNYTLDDGHTYSATTNNAPFVMEWNTARLPNGLHRLRVTACDSGGGVLHESSRFVLLSNPEAPRIARLTDDETTVLRGRLLALLTPHPSRKAAHFALAEQASARGETESALAHTEAVVAIDPEFGNARAALRRFNRATMGPQEGVWCAATEQKLIALTFDDGPNPDANRTPALLDALAAARAPATFFVVGVRAEQATDLLNRMIAEGHEIGNHSYSHPNLALLSPQSVERELCRTSVVVHRATGRRPRFYRPPGGNFNTAVVQAAEALGMAGAYWTVDALKQEDAANVAGLTRYVVDNARPGAIVLMHNAPFTTIKAVPAIVAGLRAKGYKLVTMSELMTAAQGAARPATSRTARPPARPKSVGSAKRTPKMG